MSLEPNDVELFSWIEKNWSSASIDLFTNNMPESIARESPIDFSFEAYEDSRQEAKNLFISELSKLYGVKREMITPTISGSEAIYLALLRIRQKSDQIGMILPDYAPMLDVAQSLNFRVKSLKPRQIKRGDTPVAVSIPNNPTGAVHNLIGSVRELPAFWEQPVYVDETFLEFLGENARTCFKPSRSMLVSATTVKYYGLTDTKVGWIFADEEDSDWFRRSMNLITPVIPQYPLWISYQALKHKKYFDSIVREIVPVNMKIVDEFVSDIEGLSWTKPEGTPFGFVKTGTHGSIPLCTDILQRTGVLLGPGRYFGDDTGFRLSFVIPEGQLIKALEKLRDYFRTKA